MGKNDKKFNYDSNYKADANFTRVKFGHDLPLLETELNEMQIIQEKARTSLTRRLVPSGFIELVEKEFTGEPIIYNPVENGLLKLDSIALAPSRAILNGYELTLEGNFTVDNFNNYVLVELGEAPETNFREDLVYLEVWFQNLTAEDNIKKFGYQNGNYIGYQMVDPRVNSETSRRIALCWNIRVAKDINFKQYPEGFGYTNLTNFSPIRAKANGTLTSNDSLVFMNASHSTFKNCEFYKDNNLWIAGRPDKPLESSSINGNYIYGMPLFKVTRRNKGQYSIENFNGSIALRSLNQNLVSNSSLKGDLANNIRPDKLYYDFFNAQDFIDLRKTITVKEFKQHYYLDKTIKDLFSGQLQTLYKNTMRRAQFGTDVPNIADDDTIIFNCKFNDSLKPLIPGITDPVYSSENANITYKDSLNGYGLYVDGKNSIKYNLNDFDVDFGTIDLYFQPYWYGPDSSISQKIINIIDAENNPIFSLEKKGQYLVYTQYVDVVSETNPNCFSTIQVDLKNTILLAKNIYHIRLSWSSNEVVQSAFMYINGKLVGQGSYQTSLLTPSILKVGNIETVDSGFVIENVVIYKAAFEQTTSDNLGSYFKNNYWPGLPADFISGDTLLLPSFNSVLNNFTDNGYTQVTTDVISADYEPVEGITTFTFKIPHGKTVKDTPSPIVYNVSDDATNKGVLVVGTWESVDASNMKFTTSEAVTKILIQYELVIPSGNGGYDLPNEMLAAGIITNTDGVSNISEVSFCRKNAKNPRNVSFIKPRLINGIYDTAYDYPTTRENNECFARLLNYHINGNGTNEYYIPEELYGYKVLSILSVTNKQIIYCEKLFNGTNSFFVRLKNQVLNGEVIEFKLALEGITFDYEMQSKTLVENIHKAKILEFTANGVDDEYVIPCFDDSNHGGILKAVYTYKETGTNGVTSENKVYFIDDGTTNSMHIPVYSLDGSNNQYISGYNLATYELQTTADSFGTPFLRIKLGVKPSFGQKIQIPVFVSYQPNEQVNLSIWYNHIPYQGLLSNESKTVKRLTDWKYFITTLGSGRTIVGTDEENIYSSNNIINRLPGGLAYSYLVDGSAVSFDYVASTFSNSGINKQLAFVDDVFFDEKNTLFAFDTDFTIYKNAKGFQDGKLVIEGKDFSIFFPDCAEAINKYLGMACLVVDENGELMILIIGDLVTTKSKTNKLTPQYGDLFRIPGIPTTIKLY